MWSESEIEKIARVVYAEGCVFVGKNRLALLAIAQCISDLYETGEYPSLDDCLSHCFTAPSDVLSKECIEITKAVFCKGERRLERANILQFRSFANYSDGKGNFNTAKCYDILKQYKYLGSDSISSEWGHFYFGRSKHMGNFRLLLIAGHGRNVDGSYDPGAIGNGYKEAELTRELVQLIKKKADLLGVACDVAPDRNYFSYFKYGNTYDFTPYKYVLEVHFNASSTTDYKGDGKKKGSMFFISEWETGHSVEDKILTNLYALGSVKAWDGVVISTRNYVGGLLVQNRVNAQGISHGLLETCFISDADDVAWYQAKKEAIAEAIIKGIMQGFGLTASSNATKAVNYMVKITAPALNIRKGPGINYAVVGSIRDRGSYTIVEESSGSGSKAGWGRLLSGAGWISLDYCKKI